MKKDIILKPTKPNAGIEAVYRERLLKFLEVMHRSLAFHILRAYKQRPPEMASDESPTLFAYAVMRRLSSKWLKKLDEFAAGLALYQAKKALKHSDASLSAALSAESFGVEFQMTRAMNDVFQSSVKANVSLIKSIGSEHFQKVEELVMRSVSDGRDLFTLAEELHKRYNISKSRARMIAHDQNNKMTARFVKVRQEELGLSLIHI